METTLKSFDELVADWLAACQTMLNKYYADNYTNLVPPTLTLEPGKRYIRVVRGSGQYDRSVYAFIDKTNGDILKPATWKAPAKHARGNLYDAKNGLGSMGPYGPAYLR